MIVVDASVVVKGFVSEQDSQEASRLLRSRQKLLAPEIIRIEVAAALTRLFRTGDLTASLAQKLLQAWSRHLSKQAVSLQSTERDFEAAIEISMKIRHALQDCLYVAVAERLKAPLVTADNKLLQKAELVNCELLPFNSNGTINKG